MTRLGGKKHRPKDSAWDAFSLYIRYRDNWTCCCCGAENYRNEDKSLPVMQAGHLIPRGKSSTLFAEDNVFCQCRTCNMRHRYEPQVMTQWYLRRFGQKAYDKLVERSKVLCQRKTADLNALAMHYTRLTEQIRSRQVKPLKWGAVA